MKEIAMAGPAPGRPKEVERVIKYCKRGAFKIEETCSFCPAIAVPTTVKIPEPITAPMPSEVRLSHPSDFFNRISAFSESDSSWSMFLHRNSGDATQALRSHPRPRRQPRSGRATCLRLETLHRNVSAPLYRDSPPRATHPLRVRVPPPGCRGGARPSLLPFSCPCTGGVFTPPSCLTLAFVAAAFRGGRRLLLRLPQEPPTPPPPPPSS